MTIEDIMASYAINALSQVAQHQLGRVAESLALVE